MAQERRKSVNPGLGRSLFLCFVLSGFAGLVYQIVWVRMALASFGVITPFASVVVSVFMLGLALGTWWGGQKVEAFSSRTGLSPIVLYGGLEAIIGLSAFILPTLFEMGREWLLPIGGMESGLYLAASSGVIAAAMLPWCIAMGATFPTMMAFIEKVDPEPSGSFSYLYLANVVGALLGAMATPLILIEWLGFSTTLGVAAGLNFLITGLSFWISRKPSLEAPLDASLETEPSLQTVSPNDITPRATLVVLFLTGLTAMALEIVWMRAFTPVLGTLVYAFSGLLAVYLASTFLGSALYRRHRRKGRVLNIRPLAFALPVTALLPVWMAIPRFLSSSAQGLLPALDAFGFSAAPWMAMVPLSLLSIAPFCGLLGYMTPMLVDHYAQGAPKSAGRAYALNIAGSILGPLAAAYLLLPLLGARLSMLALTVPLVILFLAYALKTRRTLSRVVAGAIAIVLALGFFQTGFRGRSFEEGSHLRQAVVRRDHTATVISFGRGFNRHLLVNGYGMTVLTTLTKIMAHLPLATTQQDPQHALVIAFGMGTTFRSMLSWDIDATAVELVPSVVDAFDYYHNDAAEVRANPKAHLRIDDGRRFLARTDERFDVITLDPPPPVETAGSSLLYASEFYELAKKRLAPGGIVHQWFPDGIQVEPAIRHAVLASATDAFPYRRVYQSHHGFGLHILLSMEPIQVPSAEAFIEKLPPAALEDLMEWAPPGTDPVAFIDEQVLAREIPLNELTGDENGPRISDDRPFNEYFVLRRLSAGSLATSEGQEQ